MAAAASSCGTPMPVPVKEGGIERRRRRQVLPRRARAGLPPRDRREVAGKCTRTTSPSPGASSPARSSSATRRFCAASFLAVHQATQRPAGRVDASAADRHIGGGAGNLLETAFRLEIDAASSFSCARSQPCSSSASSCTARTEARRTRHASEKEEAAQCVGVLVWLYGGAEAQ